MIRRENRQFVSADGVARVDVGARPHAMNGLKSGLVAAALIASFGAFAIVGCSADGSGVADDSTPTEPEESGTGLPPRSDSGGGETDDAGKTVKDAAPKDSAVDSGPPPPVPGTTCTTVDEVRKKSCGACGSQSTICLTEGAAAKWSVYSTCEGELAGGCLPGTIIDEPCGNCGTVKKTCTQYCAFTSGSCTGQPASSCVPGNVDLSGAGCLADEFRQRSCGSTCTYGNFGVSCAAPPTTVQVGPTPGSVTSTVAVLTADQQLPTISGTSCPNATLSTTKTSPYVYIQVHNPLATAASISIYNSLAAGGVAYKTALAAYAGDVSPTAAAGRAACLKATTYGTTALTGNSKFASLDGTTKGVTIAAGATISVYVAAYNNYVAANPADTTGKVNLNVLTVALLP